MSAKVGLLAHICNFVLDKSPHISLHTIIISRENTTVAKTNRKTQRTAMMAAKFDSDMMFVLSISLYASFPSSKVPVWAKCEMLLSLFFRLTFTFMESKPSP